MTRRSLLIAVFALTLLLVSSVAWAEPVKLIYWTHWEQNPLFNAYYEEAGREFAALYPDECSGVEVVTVPYSGYYARYLAAFMAGVGAPDLFNGAPHDWAGLYDFADPMPAELAAKVEETIVNTARPFGVFSGVRYGFPVEGGNFQYMFINVDMYEEVGLDPDQPPTTLDELLEHAKKLAKYDAAGNCIRSGYGIRYSGDQTGITDKFLPILHAFGGMMVDPEYKVAHGIVNSPEAVAALTFYGDLVNKYKVSSLEVGNPEVAFAQGLAGIIFRESWLPGWMELNAPHIRYKVYPLPSQTATPGPGALFGWADLVYKHSPNKELAWKFLEFMWSKEHDYRRATAQGIMPVIAENFNTEFVTSRPDYEAVMAMAAREPAPSYFHPKMNEVAAAYGDAILAVIYGQKDAQTALDEAADRIDRILKQ
jgi:multiple sugar transport system substrate-binding protein